MQNSIAGDSGVDDADAYEPRIRLKPSCQTIRPSSVTIFRRTNAISNRISHNHDHSGIAGCSDLHVRQEITTTVRFARWERGHPCRIAPSHVSRLQTDAMNR